MTWMQLLILLIVAGICGSIAQTIVGFTRGGCLVSIVLGFMGAMIGPWMAIELGLPEMLTVRIGEENFPIIWSIIGAAVVAMLVGILTPKRRS
jgi:uncharacterized membrane protein YeaQ/YmgE (transglycosylase-associated protein family)